MCVCIRIASCDALIAHAHDNVPRNDLTAINRPATKLSVRGAIALELEILARADCTGAFAGQSSSDSQATIVCLNKCKDKQHPIALIRSDHDCSRVQALMSKTEMCSESQLNVKNPTGTLVPTKPNANSLSNHCVLQNKQSSLR